MHRLRRIFGLEAAQRTPQGLPVPGARRHLDDHILARQEVDQFLLILAVQVPYAVHRDLRRSQVMGCEVVEEVGAERHRDTLPLGLKAERGEETLGIHSPQRPRLQQAIAREKDCRSPEVNAAPNHVALLPGRGERGSGAAAVEGTAIVTVPGMAHRFPSGHLVVRVARPGKPHANGPGGPSLPDGCFEIRDWSVHSIRKGSRRLHGAGRAALALACDHCSRALDTDRQAWGARADVQFQIGTALHANVPAAGTSG